MSNRPPVVTVLTAPEEKAPPGLAPLDKLAEVRLASDEAGLSQQLPDSDVLLVTDFRTEALAATWHQAQHLQWVHAASAGVDALLFPELRASSIPLTNARGVFNRAIAEYVLGVILAFAKDTRRNIELQQAHEWRHRDTERILDKRVLIIGAGAIGSDIAQLCTVAGMRVSGIARSRRKHPAFEAIHPITELYSHLASADYVVIAAPLTADTRGLFGPKAFAAMASHARLINIGRGPIVDTNALLEALEHNDIAGAGLDVFEDEPLPPDHPLWQHDNVLISAHMAGDFLGWREALSRQFLDNFERWRTGQPLDNLVDKQPNHAPS